MKKKLTAFVLALCLVFVLIGCGNQKNEYSVITSLTHTKYKNMYYDKQTKIVYFILNQSSGFCGYGYISAYYAPNGLPYLYDVESGELVEIER